MKSRLVENLTEKKSEELFVEVEEVDLFRVIGEKKSEELFVEVEEVV